MQVITGKNGVFVAAQRSGAGGVRHGDAGAAPSFGRMLLDRVLGAEVHIIRGKAGETEAETEARCFLLGKAHAERLEAEGRRCYDIPLGGASCIGSAAFVGGFCEFIQQCGEAGIQPDYLYTATGTGGTLSGLVAGRKLLEAKVRITAIAVSDKKPDYEANCAALANESLEWLGSGERVDAADFTVDRGYFAPGYEKPNEASTEAIRLLARAEGLLTDPVYTGKAFAGLLGHIRSGAVAPGSTVVFWHTGGATALFAEREILGALTEEAWSGY